MKRFCVCLKFCLSYLFAAAFFLTSTLPAMALTISDTMFDSSARDFTQITGSYDTNNVYFTATFRAGTLQTDGLGLSFYLNTDMNSATGSGGIGIDYSIFFHQPTGTTATGAFVTNTVSGVQTGLAAVNFTADFLSIAVPLTWLSNDDGVMLFTALVGNAVFGEINPFTGRPRRLINPEDFAPDAAGLMTWAGPTTSSAPVPEPSTFLLFGAGLAGLAVWRKRRS